MQRLRINHLPNRGQQRRPQPSPLRMQRTQMHPHPNPYAVYQRTRKAPLSDGADWASGGNPRERIARWRLQETGSFRLMACFLCFLSSTQFGDFAIVKLLNNKMQGLDGLSSAGTASDGSPSIATSVQRWTQPSSIFHKFRSCVDALFVLRKAH